MTKELLPKDIYAYLAKKVLGQEPVLKKVAVAVYKHINGLKAGNLLLMGNSGTGKTTIMQSIRDFYDDHEALHKYRTMTVMNANMLRGEEENEVDLMRLFRNLERDVLNLLGPDADPETIRDHMEHATVCLDETDKISSRIAGKVNSSGIAVQQALLTLLEGESVLYETTVLQDGTHKPVRFPVDTSRMLFICGGAFEELYDQVYDLILHKKDERRLKESGQMGPDGRIHYKVVFKLKDYLRLSDLFTFGMVPQFVSRFNSIGVLDDLSKEDLKQILLHADDSPYRFSREYFASMGIELNLTQDALDLIAAYALENTRIGARALREIFTSVIAEMEFDPASCDKVETTGEEKVLSIDREAVESNLEKRFALQGA